MKGIQGCSYVNMTVCLCICIFHRTFFKKEKILNLIMWILKKTNSEWQNKKKIVVMLLKIWKHFLNSVKPRTG